MKEGKQSDLGFEREAKGSMGRKSEERFRAQVRERTAQLRMANRKLKEEIAEHVRTEEALRESEKRFRLLAENAVDVIWTMDLEGTLTYVSPSIKHLTGHAPEDLLGIPITERHRPESVKELMRIIAEELAAEKINGVDPHRRRTLEIEQRHRDGHFVWTEATASFFRDEDGNPVGIVGVSRDIRLRKKMKEELLKAQKLESIGILAGGLAHDFNNLLTSILGNISLAARHVERGGRADRLLSEAEKAAIRAKNLTQQLLTFSAGGAPVRETASLPAILRDAFDFLLRGSNIRYTFSLPDDLWPVEIDRAQIRQLVNNIVINAKQAMVGGGTLEARAENVVLEEGEMPPLAGGKYVQLSIRDSGPGVPREHLSKIFDPYFTTRELGSGLGLTVSYSIAKRHGGHISVESEDGAGTTLTVYLPGSAEPEVCGEGDRQGLCFGRGRILVMDDDEMIRSTVGEVLEYLGYEAICARDGAEAIDKYLQAREAGHPFDAVIMDLTVPGGMGGKEAMRRLLEEDPEIVALVSSGYSNDPIMSEYREYGFRGVITKPYKLEHLSEILRRVLSWADGPR